MNRVIQRELYESKGWHSDDTSIIQNTDQLLARDRGQPFECCRELCLVNAHDVRQIRDGVNDVAEVCERACGDATKEPKFGADDVARQFRCATRPKFWPVVRVLRRNRRNHPARQDVLHAKGRKTSEIQNEPSFGGSQYRRHEGTSRVICAIT